MSRIIDFIQRFYPDIPIFGKSNNIICNNNNMPISGLCKRQGSSAGHSSIIQLAPQTGIDSSYPADTDYCVFIVKKLTPDKSLEVCQYLFDSRPFFLKLKPLTVAKNVYFSYIQRYSNSTESFLAIGGVDQNSLRLHTLNTPHFDNIVVHHVIKEPLLTQVMTLFRQLNNDILRPKHVLIDFRTEPTLQSDRIALTAVAVPRDSNSRAAATASASSFGTYVNTSAPACHDDIQPFIEFLNMIAPHSTPAPIIVAEAKQRWITTYGEEMPANEEAKIIVHNDTLTLMQTYMTRQFKRHIYNIDDNVLPNNIKQIDLVIDQMILSAAIIIINGVIQIKKDDVINTMNENLNRNFPNWTSLYPNLLTNLLNKSQNINDIEWPQAFMLIDWCLIDPPPAPKTKRKISDPKDPKDYMVFVQTTIDQETVITFAMLEEQVSFMKQKHDTVKTVTAGGKHRKSRSKTKQKRNKRRNTKKKYNQKKRRSSQRKCNKRRKSKKR